MSPREEDEHKNPSEEPVERHDPGQTAQEEIRWRPPLPE